MGPAPGGKRGATERKGRESARDERDRPPHGWRDHRPCDDARHGAGSAGPAGSRGGGPGYSLGCAGGLQLLRSPPAVPSCARVRVCACERASERASERVRCVHVCMCVCVCVRARARAATPPFPHRARRPAGPCCTPVPPPPSRARPRPPDRTPKQARSHRARAHTWQSSFSPAAAAACRLACAAGGIQIYASTASGRAPAAGPLSSRGWARPAGGRNGVCVWAGREAREERRQADGRGTLCVWFIFGSARPDPARPRSVRLSRAS